jgi:ATP-dependent DNA helicase RecG
MRPALLDPFFASVARLQGVGGRTAALLDRLLDRVEFGARVIDLLFHLPVGAVDRRLSPNLASAPIGSVATVRVRVAEHRPPPPSRPKTPYKVLMEDETGDLSLIFFRTFAGQMEKAYPIGAERIVSGTIELFDGFRQMPHPDRVLPVSDLDKLKPFEPVYPLTEGLSSRKVHAFVNGALGTLKTLPEWLDPALVEKRGWPAFSAALTALHNPAAMPPLDADTPGSERLAYDELLASQLALVLVRGRMKAAAGRKTIGTGERAGRIRAALPWSLTRAQEKALEAIAKDMTSGERMLRLLQGDVGSGKTVVGLLAMAAAVEAGRQAAMMAPTEILARQHFERLQPLCEAAEIRLALLTGRARAGERARTLAALQAGDIDIVVGTHALFQEDVGFRDLALAIVDEQHRFGVHQRLALSRKGEAVDLLVMTATPIPRSLVLTYFGDMDVSILDEKPAGRLPIDTRLIDLERMGEVVAGLERAIRGGARIYWVCPLVAESEKIDLSAATDRHDDLEKWFPGRVGLVHGQMKGADKDEAVRRFQAGEIDILVSTTVIEVGVDVPEASIMVIEHAERFGLAQLHQLRGRVGRGAAKSSCLLLYKGPLGEVAQARLKMMRETEDGFRIAEEDLRLRGEGDVLGTRQSGSPGFRIARLERHGALLRMARDDAELMLGRDPDLVSPRGEALRLLLHLFERGEAVKLFRAG